MLSAQMMTAMELLPLACLCLLTCSAAASADGNEPVKVIVMEDSDAILPCSLGSGVNIESRLFDWRKDYQKDGSKDVFMYDGKKQDLLRQSEQFRGRVSHFPDELKNGNASIKITKTKLADGGNYTCIFPNLQPQRKFNIELVVGAAPEPIIRTLEFPKDRALLQCEVLGASPKPQLQWQDSDGNLVPAKDPQEEKRGGSYDIILQATVTKTNNYSCVVTQKEINHQTQAHIYVSFNGAASKPSLTTLDETRNWVLLQCEVLGASPKPQLQWQDSDGNLVPAKDPQEEKRGGSYDIILQATVTKTDTYRCVVTQKEINHQTQAETFVRINESSQSSSTGWIVAGVVSTLFVVVVVPLVIKLKKASGKNPQSRTSTKEESPYIQLTSNIQRTAVDGNSRHFTVFF